MLDYKEKINELKYEGFKILDNSDADVFLPFSKNIKCGDKAFSLLYAWQESFNYLYKKIDNAIIIIENSNSLNPSIILLTQNKSDIVNSVQNVYQIFNDKLKNIKFNYVSEDELLFYKLAVEKLNKNFIINSNPDNSDYIYRTEDFLCLDGKTNKRKRGDMNYLLRYYPDINIKYHSKDCDLTDSASYVFDKWCNSHKCQYCVYGCEKKAFKRFMDVFNYDDNKLCVSFSDNKPLSFALSGKVGDNSVCYYFQKNGDKIRGLTYWLNRQMALQHQNIDYINLAEDMGLEGLREDKQLLHPCFLMPKYSVEIQQN